MINFLKRLPDWLYKKKCYICNSSKENKTLCSACFEAISFLPYESINKYLNVNFYSLSIYEDNLKKLIRGIKYHNQKELDLYLAKLLFKYWQNLNLTTEKYIIIPVPMFKKKLKKRKYNHMDLIAQKFSELTDYETDFYSIKRIKDTKPQYNLTKKQREKNLKDAFIVLPENLLNKKILLLDDITTTGSTLIEIIKELNKHNISDITALTLATPSFH